MDTEPNLYKILQIDPEAEPGVVAAAYRRLAQKYHPDTGGSNASEDEMSRLNLAYEVLSDPVKRKQYDRELAEEASISRLNETAEIQRRTEQEAMQEAMIETLVRSRATQQRPMSNLDGNAVIKAGDGTYLGLVSSNRMNPDSITNPHGKYGSTYLPTSIRNEYGTYGGPYGFQSPYNQYCSQPPMIVQRGRNVAYLTVNPHLSPAISPHDLLATLGS